MMVKKIYNDVKRRYTTSIATRYVVDIKMEWRVVPAPLYRKFFKMKKENFIGSKSEGRWHEGLHGPHFNKK